MGLFSLDLSVGFFNLDYMPSVFPLSWIRQSLPILLLFLLIIGCGKKSSGSNDADAQREVYPLNPSQRDYFPTTGWQKAEPESVGLKTETLQKLDDYAFGKDEDEDEHNTRALVIIKNGYLVFEKYHETVRPDTKHGIWSISKSLINALLGIAVRQGKINIEDPLAKYVPALDTREKRQILISHSLQMSSGLSWQEGYEYAPLKSSVIAMLYTAGRKNMPNFVGNRPSLHPPGQVVHYASGETMLLSGALKNALGADAYLEFAWQELFEPIGMDVTWEKDGNDHLIGSSYVFVSARDLAKFAFLYLNNGFWDNQKIITEDWLLFSRKPAPGYFGKNQSISRETIHSVGILSAHWLVNANISSRSSKKKRPYPILPKDTFYMTGHWGQALFIIPSWDMIFIRYGADRDDSFDLDLVFELLEQGVLVF